MVRNWLEALGDTLTDIAVSEEVFAARTAAKAKRKANRSFKFSKDFLEGPEYKGTRDNLRKYELAKAEQQKVLEYLTHYGVSDMPNAQNIMMMNMMNLEEAKSKLISGIKREVMKNNYFAYDEKRVNEGNKFEVDIDGAYKKDDWQFILDRVGDLPVQSQVQGEGEITFAEFMNRQHQAVSDARFVNDTMFTFQRGTSFDKDGKDRYGKYYNQEEKRWDTWFDQPGKIDEIITQFTSKTIGNPMMGYYHQGAMATLGHLKTLAEEGRLDNMTAQVVQKTDGIANLAEDVTRKMREVNALYDVEVAGETEWDETWESKSVGGEVLEDKQGGKVSGKSPTIAKDGGSIQALQTAIKLEFLGMEDAKLLNEYGLTRDELKDLFAGKSLLLGSGDKQVTASLNDIEGLNLGDRLSKEVIDRDMAILDGFHQISEAVGNIQYQYSQDSPGYLWSESEYDIKGTEDIEKGQLITDGTDASFLHLSRILMNSIDNPDLYREDGTFNDSFLNMEGLTNFIPMSGDLFAKESTTSAGWDSGILREFMNVASLHNTSNSKLLADIRESGFINLNPGKTGTVTNKFRGELGYWNNFKQGKNINLRNGIGLYYGGGLYE